MHFILAITYCVWFLSEVIMSRMLRSGQADRSGTDKHSLTVIWVLACVSVVIAAIIDHFLHTPIFPKPIYRLIGAGITLIGMVIRIIAVKTLGRLFTVHLTIRKDHSLKTDGIYSLIRHPAYAGCLLSFFGLGLAINNWWSFLVISVSVTTAFIIRIRMEEKLLDEEFGADYTRYKTRTARLIPFIY